MKKTIKAVLTIMLTSMLCLSCSALANASGFGDQNTPDILFNGIPWQSSYSEVIASLTNLYGVSFSEPKMEYFEPKDKINNLHLPFSLATGFSVHSTQTALIADYPAYIYLRFVFPNNGGRVLNDNIEQANFVEAKYYLWRNSTKSNLFSEEYPDITNNDFNDASKKCETLKIKLKSIYGFEGIFRGSVALTEDNPQIKESRVNWYQKRDKDGNEIDLRLIYELVIRYSSSVDMSSQNRAILEKQIEAENQSRQNIIAAGNKDGL